MPMRRTIRVASRDSLLAVTQSKLIMTALQAADPDLVLELITMKTTGDLILDQTLDKIGGKGLFVKELDRALLDGRADIAVHSLKDLPMDTDPNLPIVALSKREDPRDVLILPEGRESLDPGRPIGCSSARRRIQLQALYPDVPVASVRGNVQTRLAKLDRGDFSALVLAYAGIRRLGLEARVSRVFEPDEMVPACGQGILAVQARADFDPAILQSVHDPAAWDEAQAERSFVRALDGGCSLPIAAFAVASGSSLNLTGFFHDEISGLTLTRTLAGSRSEAVALGREAARQIRAELAKGQTCHE